MGVPHLTAAHLERLLAVGPPAVSAVRLALPMAAAASRHAATLRARAYDRVRRHGALLSAATAEAVESLRLGVPASQIALPPLATFAGGHDAESLALLARLLDTAATDCGVEAIDGFATSPEASPTDEAALAILPQVLADTSRLHAMLACAAAHAPRYTDALGRTLEAAYRHTERLALTCGTHAVATDGDAHVAVVLSYSDALSRLTASALDRDAVRLQIEVMVTGLARAGTLLAERTARALSRRSGLPVRSGAVTLDAEVPVGWDPLGMGALATLGLVDAAARAGARRAQAHARITMRAAPPVTHPLPLELALVGDGVFVLPAAPPAHLAADLGAVCAATGHAATLRFAPPRA